MRSVTQKDRIDFTEAQRRRLARVGKDLTPAEREEHCEIVRPRTILEWFRRIYAAKYDSSRAAQAGPPPKPQQVRDLVIKIAQDNLSWGYTKIHDAVNTGLRIDICRITVAKFLHAAGIVPGPERAKQRTWQQFTRSHWDCLYACDFFTVEVLGIFGAVRYSVFFVMELQTRAAGASAERLNSVEPFSPPRSWGIDDHSTTTVPRQTFDARLSFRSRSANGA